MLNNTKITDSESSLNESSLNDSFLSDSFNSICSFSSILNLTSEIIPHSLSHTKQCHKSFIEGTDEIFWFVKNLTAEEAINGIQTFCEPPISKCQW